MLSNAVIYSYTEPHYHSSHNLSLAMSLIIEWGILIYEQLPEILGSYLGHGLVLQSYLIHLAALPAISAPLHSKTLPLCQLHSVAIYSNVQPCNEVTS